ncbi:MAG: hypothetical protein ACRERV_07585 [Methylococcales bacterium]
MTPWLHEALVYARRFLTDSLGLTLSPENFSLTTFAKGFSFPDSTLTSGAGPDEAQIRSEFQEQSPGDYRALLYNQDGDLRVSHNQLCRLEWLLALSVYYRIKIPLLCCF